MNSQRIVILGGSGFVGSHLTAQLSARGHRITVLSRNAQRHRALGVLPAVNVVDADVYDGATLARHFAGADAVINLVGILNERGFNGAGFERAHVALTRGVIAAMAQAGVSRLLQMSALNAGRGDSHYLRTRGAAEALVKASTLRWTIFEPSVIFGPGDGLFCRFASLLKLAPVLPLARANAKFAPVYVGDVCAAFIRALGDDTTLRRSYQLYGTRVMSLREVVTYTRDALGLTRVVVGLPDVLGRVQALAMDFVPGKPFSTDNYRSLALDSVGTEDGLAALGVTATPVETIVPRCLTGEDNKQRTLDRNRRARRYF